MKLGDYQLGEVLAVQWHDGMRRQFAHITHTYCRQEMHADIENNRWVPFDPPRCIDYHCPRCGWPTNIMGHHQHGQECQVTP